MEKGVGAEWRRGYGWDGEGGRGGMGMGMGLDGEKIFNQY